MARNGKGLATAVTIALLLVMQLPPFPVARAAAATTDSITPAAIIARPPQPGPRSEAQALNGITEQTAFLPDPPAPPVSAFVPQGPMLFSQSGIVINPTSFDYPAAAIGVSRSANFTATNQGTTTWIDPTVAIGGRNSADFKLTSFPCSSVAPGNTCPFNVDFIPVDSGQRLGNFVFNAGSAGQSDPVPLSGFGQGTADDALTMTSSASAISVGQAVTFTIVVRNGGPNTSISTTVTDTLPAGLRFVSAINGRADGAPCSGPNAQRQITCALDDLASGMSETILITASGETAGTQTNTASVVTGATDPNAANNNASLTIGVTAQLSAAIASVSAPNLMQLVVSFVAPMSTSGATDIQDGAHYALSGGLVVGGGQASADFTSVTLTLSCAQTPCQRFTPGAAYTLSVTGLADRAGTFFPSGAWNFTVPADVHVTLEQPGTYTLVLTASQPLDQRTVSAGAITWDGNPFPGRVTLQGGDGTFCDGAIADSCLRHVRLTFVSPPPAVGATHTLGIASLRDLAGRQVEPMSFSVILPTDTTAPASSIANFLYFGQNSGPGTPYLPVHRINVHFSEAMRSTQDGFAGTESADVLGNYSLTNADGTPALSPTGAAVSIAFVSYKPGGARSSAANPRRFKGTRAQVILNTLLAPGSYRLNIASTVSDDSGSALGPTSLAFTVPVEASLGVTTVSSTQNQLFVSFNEDISTTAANASTPTSYTSADPTLQAVLSGMTPATQGSAGRAAIYTDARGFGPFSFDGRGVTFTYPSTLPTGTYSMKISGLSNAFGTPMADQTVTFAVADPTATTLSASALNSAQIQVSFASAMATSGATDIQDGAHYTLSDGLIVGNGQSTEAVVGPGPTSTSARLTHSSGFANTLDGGDVVTIDFNQRIFLAADAVIQVTDSDCGIVSNTGPAPCSGDNTNTVANISCGVTANCTLQAGPSGPNSELVVTLTGLPSIIAAGSTVGAQLPLLVSDSSGITNGAASWDLANSSDRVIDQLTTPGPTSTNVTLTLTCIPACQRLVPGKTYTISASGLADRSGNLLPPATGTFTVPADVTLTLDQPGAYTMLLTSSQPLDETTIAAITWDGTTFPGRVTLQAGGGSFCAPPAAIAIRSGLIPPGLTDTCHQRVRFSFNASSLPAQGSTHALAVSGLRDAAGRATNPQSFQVTIPTDTTPPTASFLTSLVNLDNPTAPTTYVPIHQLALSFGEPMRVSFDGFPNPQAVNYAGNYTLTRADGSAAVSPTGVPVTITHISSKGGGTTVSIAELARFEGIRARLSLSGLLAPGSYNLAIAGTLSDDAGNAVGSTTLSFTVPADTAPPTVTNVYSSPTQLFVSFSEDVSATSTHAATNASYSSTDPKLQAALSGMTPADQGTAARAALYNDVNGFGPFSYDGFGQTFTYPSALPPGTYTMQISGVTDLFGNLMTPQTVTFTIPGAAASPSLVSVTAPNLMQVAVTFANAMQTAGAAAATDGAHYTLLGGGGELFLGTGAASADRKTVTLNLSCAHACQTLSAGTSYTLSVTNVADTSGKLVSGTLTFTPSDTTPPTLTLAGQPGSATILLFASEALAQGPAKNIVNYTWNGGSFPGTVTVQGGDGNACDLSFQTDRCMQRILLTLTTPMNPATYALGVANLTDLAGNPLSPNPTTFQVTLTADTTVPAVTKTTPVPFSALTPGGPAVTAVNIDFSESMSASAGAIGNYALQNADGSPATTTGVPGTGSPLTISFLSFDGRAASTFRFQRTRSRPILSGMMAPGAAYKLVLSNLTDDAGNPLGTTTLTLSGPADTVAPTVTSVLSTSQQLLVTFSELLFRDANGAGNPASYTSTESALQASLTGMTVASFGSAARQAWYSADFFGSVSGDATGAIFNYSTPLPAGTYHLTIAGVSDDFGNALTPTTVTFTVQNGVGTPTADVALAMTASATAITVGQSVSFTITATNGGPDTATTPVISDTLPAGLAFVSSTGCTGPDGQRKLTCALADIPGGGTASVTIVASATSAGAQTNTASVATSSSDPVSGNNSASQTVTVANPPPCAPALAGLAAWWPANNSPADVVTGRPAQLLGGATFAPGKVHEAFSLNGASSWVHIDGEPQPPAVSVAFWFNSRAVLDGSTSHAPFVVNLTENDDMLFVTRGYDFVYEFGGIRFGLPGVSGGRHNVSFPTSFAPNTWHFVVGTYDPSGQRLYIDGVAVPVFEQHAGSVPVLVGTTAPFFGPPAYQPSPLLIGRDRNTAHTGEAGFRDPFFFNGLVDELQVYSRALTPGEVGQIYNADSSGVCATTTQLRVSVQDQTGAVLAGVYVEADDPNTPGILVANATTSAQGVASLFVPINSTVKVFIAGPPGLLDQWWQNRQSFDSADPVAIGTTPVTIGPVTLAAGATITGHVADSATNSMLTGATVTAYRADEGDACCLFENQASTSTGSFILAVHPNHAFALYVQGPQGTVYVPRWALSASTFETATAVMVGAAGSTTDIKTVTLDPGVRLSGSVVDASTGLGIAGIDVNVNLAGPVCCVFENGGRTSSDGTFSVAVHLNRSYKVRISSPTNGPAYVAVWYPASPDSDHAAVIDVGATDRALDPARLVPGVRITGVVRKPAGGPVSQAGVSAEDATTRERVTNGHVDGQGNIDLVVPPNRSYKFGFHPDAATGLAPQYYQGKRNFENGDPVAVGTATKDLGTVTLEAGVVISGTVTDEQNQPIANANVNAQLCTPDFSCQFENGAQTGTDGTFALTVHASSTYLVRTNGPFAANPPYVPEWYDDKPRLGLATPVIVGTAAIRLNPIRLALGVRLTGTVTGSGPLANVFVSAEDATTGQQAAPGTSTLADGTFTLIVPRNRSYKVRFAPQNPGDGHLPLWLGGTASFADATVIAVQTADVGLGTTDLPLGVRLTGVVLDHVTKQTIAGAFVNANVPTGGCCTFLFGTQTNADGRFSLLVATNASYKINTTVAPTAAPYVSQLYDNKDGDFNAADIVVVGASGFALHTIELVPGLRLQGFVRTAGVESSGIGGIQVRVFAGGGCCIGLGGATTAPDGTYAAIIPAGTDFKVMFTSTDGLRYAAQWNGGAPDYASAATLSGSAGATVTVDAAMTPGFVVSGILTDRITRQPAANVGARLVFANGGIQAVVTRASSDGTGVFRLVVAGGADAGYKLRFASDVYVAQWWNDQPTIDKANTFTVVADDTAKNAALDRLLATGTAACVLPRVQQASILIPNAAVDLFIGETLTRSFTADARGAFSLFALAPSTTYVFRYKGTVGTRVVECYGPLLTDATGTATIGAPMPNNQNHTWVSALRINGGDSIRDAITRPHGAVWYRMAIAPQQQIRIDLTGLTRDYNLTVYRDLRQLANAMNAQYSTLAGVQAVTSGAVNADSIDGDSIDGDSIDGDSIDGDSIDGDSIDGDSIDADSIDGDSIDGDSIDGDSIDGDNIDANGDGDTGFGPVYESVQRRALRAVSAKPATTPEALIFNTRGLTGDLYIRARGAFGASDAANQFTLVAQRVTDASCTGATFAFHAPTTSLAALPSGKRTLILTNTAALGLGATPALDPTRLTLAAAVGSADLSLTVNETIPGTWTQTGWLLIDSEVVHYTGYSVATKTFTLDMRADLGTTAAGHPSGAGAQKRSLSKSEFLAVLGGIAGRPEVQGAVFDLANDAGIALAYADWALFPRCVAHSNLVTDSIRALITLARAQNPLEYIVNAGGHRVIPFRAVPDRAEIARESGYNPPVEGASISESTLIGDWFLSDDYYATANPIARFDHDLYVPDLAIGRLAEYPEDMVAYLRAYTELGGVVRPRRALSTGYNFTTDLAQYISALLAKQDDPAGIRFTVDSLISDTWSSADLRTFLFGANHYDILSIQGHFQANRLVPADNGPRISSTEVAAITDGRLKGTLFESLGCHSGYNIVDPDSIPGVTQPVAWPEALLMRGATGVIGTGYQYGDTTLMQNTELLLATLTQELGYSEDPTFVPWGPDGVPIGKALRAAKNAYVAQLAKLSGIDEKVIGVSTVYGLPQMRYALPRPIARTRPGAVTPTPTSTSGLSALDVAQTYLISGSINNPPSVGDVFTLRPQDGYYDAGSPFDTAVEPYRPIRPKTVKNVQPTFSTIPRGAVLVRATYDEMPFTPRLSIPATELARSAPTYVTPVFLPIRPFQLNTVGGQTFVATPFQFRSPAPGQGTARIVRTLSSRLYYSSRTGPTSLAGAAGIRSIAITRNDAGMLVVVVEVTGQNDPGLADVFVTYTSESGLLHGTWMSNSTPDGATTTPLTATTFLRRYTFTIDPQGDAGAVRLMVQVVNGVGDVTVASNNGTFFRFVAPPTPPPPGTPPPVDTRPNTALAVSASPSPVSFHGVLSVGATLQTTAMQPAPVPGRAVTVTFNGNVKTATTDSNGVATASFVVNAPPSAVVTYPVRAVFLEDGVAHGSSGETNVTVTKGSSSFALTPPASVQYSDGVVVGTLQVPGPKGVIVPLGEAPVVLSLMAQGAPTRQVGTTTDANGRVPFDTLDFGGVMPGSYTVSLEFGTTAAGVNPLYAEARAPAFPLSVLPEDGTLTTTVPGPILSISPFTLTGQVAQANDGAPGDLARATLHYDLISDTGATCMGNGTVNSMGVSTAKITGCAAGLYTVTGGLTGAYASPEDRFLLPIYDPTVFVTAGGWILTTAGGSSGLPLGEKVNFGFNLKYTTGTTPPTGDLQVNLTSKPLTFKLKGKSFDWLVINGNHGEFEGTGDLNGATVRFRVIVDQGTPGDFEVRVWDPASGGSFDAPRYRAFSLLGGGSIKLH